VKKSLLPSRSARWSVLGCIGALALTACGSASNGAAGSDSQITLGVIGSFHGSQASSALPALPAIQAWASSVNDAGGLNGHTIKLIIKEDNDSAATGLAAARELITRDHVVALIDDYASTDAQWGPYTQKAGIPVIGGDDLSQFDTNPMFFPTGASSAPQLQIALKAAAAQGATKLAVPYCSEIAICASGAKGIAQIGAGYGIKTVWTGQFSTTAPSYTAQCLAAKSSGADSMYVVAGSDAVVRFSTACASQGMTVLEVGDDGAITDTWLKTPALARVAGAESVAPWFVSSSPATQEFHAAMKKYAPDTSLNAAASLSWAAGKLFEAAYKAAGSPDKLTTAKILDGLYALKGETLGGLTPPLTYTKGKATTITCGFAVGISDGKYVAPDGLIPSCVS